MVVAAHNARWKRGSQVNKDVSKTSYVAIVMAVVAAFVVSAVWYSPFLFGKPWMELRGVDPAAAAELKMPAWKTLVEAVRELTIAYVLSRFVRDLGIVDWKRALSLGFWVWIGFPVVMLVGASLWDNKPWMLSLIHAGDWLTKMLVMAVILTKWRGIGASSSQ